MIGDLIAKIRTEKNMTKTELARITNINIGHLTHIEKGERNPSLKTLKLICKALDVPFQQVMYAYDKKLDEDPETYNLVEHIPYDKVLAIDNIGSFITCPPNFSSASFAIKLNDSSLEPKYTKGDYLFVELNSPLKNSEFGVFSLNKKIIIRKFSVKNSQVILSPLSKDFSKIIVTENDEFYIIGKILGN